MDNSNNFKIVLDKVHFIYRDDNEQITALQDLSFSIRNNEFVCILGPSGCGKSTILRLIAGFMKPTTGKVLVNGHLVQQPGADCGVVFQTYSLFPWKRVRENIEFGLRMKKIPKHQRHEIVTRYLEAVGLAEFGNSYPQMLSVGMQQRVGIARAYANDPDILLMDEPFAALDMQAGIKMRELLLQIWNENPKTIVFITHDIDEAIELADRIILLSSRPGMVKEEYDVNLPRPRSGEFFMNAEYVELRKKITSAVFDY